MAFCGKLKMMLESTAKMPLNEGTPFIRKPSLYISLFVFAFFIRLIYLMEMKETPLFSVLMGDAKSYDLWAQQIAQGNWLGQKVFYQAPFYPYFLGFIYSFIERDLFFVRLIQIFLGSLSCLFLACAGRSFFSPKIGILAGFLLAIYPPAIFFDGLIQKGTFGLFFTTLILFLMGNTYKERRPAWIFLTGIALGLFVLTRENALVLFFLIIFWLLLYFKDLSILKRFVWVTLFVLGIGLMLLPVGFRNKAVSGNFLLTTSQLGPNFYFGNNPQSRGQYKPLVPERGNPEYEQIDATRLAEAARGRKLSPKEVSQYWLLQAFDYIRTQPGNWGKLMLRKWALVWNTQELIDTESYEVYRDFSGLLKVFGWFHHFGVIVPLAVVGLVVTWPQRKELWVLYIMLFFLALGVTLFYVFARYRFPMVPILILFASAGIPYLFQLIQSRHYQKLGLYGTLIFITALFSNWPIKLQADPKALTYHNLGYALSDRGSPEEAYIYFMKSLQFKPDSISARRGLATVLSKMNRFQEAEALHRQILQARPNQLDSKLNMGNLLARQGKYQEAFAWYQQALQLDPNNAEVHNNMGNIFLLQGDVENAIQHYLRAVQLKPNHLEAHMNLANAYTKKENLNQAVFHYKEALRINPKFHEAQVQLEKIDALQKQNIYEP